jgi:FkbH-like protein
MYLEDMKRDIEEQAYRGPKEDFLASLGLRFKISPAGVEDLKRAEELTKRTSQLNASGLVFSYEQLDHFRTCPGHDLLVCELTDKYGSYGKIGLALVEKTGADWRIRLLLMSCRVISRGVGTVLLLHIMQQAKSAGKRLLADFRMTDRNKMMYIMYKFANFKERSKDGHGDIVLENSLADIPVMPGYIDLETTKTTIWN